MTQMSESMTSREIEDVLSSIRRLVSEETRTSPRPEAVSRAPDTAGVAEKLVLTPAFRVADPVAAPAEDEAEDEAGDVWTGDDGGLGARIAVLEAAVAQRADEWEPDGSEEAHSDFVPHVLTSDPTPVADEDHFAEPEPEPMAESLPEAEAAASDPQDWQPEVTPEPEAEPEAVKTPEPMEWQDEPRVAAPPPQAAAEAEDALFDDDAGEDLLDEEVLRDMIREIIRQELQGTLGERITRNVRKLVRAEINRAMAAKAFE
jgi:hypothetical protein